MQPFLFRQAPDHTQIELLIFPAPTDQVVMEEAMRMWQVSEFSKCYLDQRKLEDLVQQAQEQLTDKPWDPIDDDSDQTSNPLISATVGEKRDGRCAIEVVDDNMLAELTIYAPFGGLPVEMDQIKAELKSKQVRYGVNLNDIKNLMLQAEKVTPGEKVSAIIAQGTPPGKGTPSQFEYLVTPIEDRILTPQTRSDGTFDMHNLGDIEIVEENDPLVRRIPAKPGESGSDVTGAPIPAPKPSETSFDADEGTQISPDDPNLLIATRKGVPQKRPRGMKVDDVLMVSDVDLRTGNLEYEGNIFVRGDVKNGLEVKSKGDIFINGIVENACVEAEGKVVIKLGIVGNPEDLDANHSKYDGHLCMVKAKNILAHYAQHAALEAEDKIELGAQLLHCQVLRCRELRVGSETKRNAKFVGGTSYVRESVHVGTLGSRADTKTVIHFGRNIAPYEKKLKSMRKEMDRKLKAINDTMSEAQMMKQQKHQPDMQENLKKLAITLHKMRQEAEVFGKNLKRLEKTVESARRKCQIHIYGVVMPNAEIDCLEAHHKFKDQLKDVHLGVKGDRWRTLNLD